jgi:hypothetical protein
LYESLKKPSVLHHIIWIIIIILKVSDESITKWLKKVN